MQSTFQLEQYDGEYRYERDGEKIQMSRDEVYENARYMLERILPAAEHWNVQMACHLEDPPAPELAGVEMWNWPVRIASRTSVWSPGCLSRGAFAVDLSMDSFLIYLLLVGAGRLREVCELGGLAVPRLQFLLRYRR